MNLKTLSLAILLSFLYTSANATSASEASENIQAAEDLWNKTKSAGHEWTTIKPLVAQAKQAFNSKDYAAAVELSSKATKQAELALIQAEHEKTNWLNNLPK